MASADAAEAAYLPSTVQGAVKILVTGHELSDFVDHLHSTAVLELQP